MTPLAKGLRSAAALMLLASWGGSAAGHESLYLYAEVNLSAVAEGTGGELVFSVHAAELPSAAALGADPLGTSLEWMARTDAAGRARLLEEAAAFVVETFSLGLDGAEPAPPRRGLRFDETWPEGAEADEIEGEGEGAARPGFLAASSALPPQARELCVSLSPRAGKRLLLVLNRPRSFPKVHDLAPGESIVLKLPTAAP